MTSVRSDSKVYDDSTKRPPELVAAAGNIELWWKGGQWRCVHAWREAPLLTTTDARLAHGFFVRLTVGLELAEQEAE